MLQLRMIWFPEAVQRIPWASVLWFMELRGHGYPAAASDLADRTLEWFEGRTSDWRRDLGQSYVYAMLLSVAGRWAESQLILEVVLEAYPERSNVALELAYVLVMQGHRDQAFRAIGLTPFSNDLVVRAWVEAALGEPERAMELLRECGGRFSCLGGASSCRGPFALKSVADLNRSRHGVLHHRAGKAEIESAAGPSGPSLPKEADACFVDRAIDLERSGCTCYTGGRQRLTILCNGDVV